MAAASSASPVWAAIYQRQPHQRMKELGRIHFEGMHYRHDIAARALRS